MDSPEYDCQFVLVTNETAVFKAWSGSTPGNPRDWGRDCLHSLERRRAATIDTNEKASTLRT